MNIQTHGILESVKSLMEAYRVGSIDSADERMTDAEKLSTLEAELLALKKAFLKVAHR